MSWNIYAGISGFIFACGLAIAGMTRPSKVQAFLDPLGQWDPSLAFVMMGAIAVTAVLYRIIFRGRFPWRDPHLHLPERKDVDVPLVLGAMLFGVGWGLVGYCPGPAIVSLPTLDPEVWVFVAAMMVGMFVFDHRRR